MDSEPKTPDEIEVDRLLGDRALFPLSALQPMGGPSEPTLYRAEREGLIKFVRNGRINCLTRGTVKRILIEGFGPVSFLYGEQSAREKRGPGLVRARLALAEKRRAKREREQSEQSA